MCIWNHGCRELQNFSKARFLWRIRHSTLLLDKEFALSFISRILSPDCVILGISHHIYDIVHKALLVSVSKLDHLNQGCKLM